MNASPESSGGKRRSVLVVDDERGPRESLRLILASHFEVFTAESGEQALETLRREAIDVVTLDLKMPGLSGAETLEAIKRIDPGLEVVVVTGYGTFDSAVEVLRLRAFDYIIKPFDALAILEVVARAAERHGRSQAEETAEILAPLDRLLEEASLLEESASPRLSDRDRAVLDHMRHQLVALRRRACGLPAESYAPEPARGRREGH